MTITEALTETGYANGWATTHTDRRMAFTRNGITITLTDPETLTTGDVRRWMDELLRDA